jgi:hypothetical protein
VKSGNNKMMVMTMDQRTLAGSMASTVAGASKGVEKMEQNGEIYS